MDPIIAVVATSDQLEVIASVLHGATYLHLDEGDEFTASAGSLQLALVEQSHTDDTIRYSVAFPPSAEAVDVTVQFVRAGRRGAPASTVRVPAPFEITSPTPKGLARGDALSLSVSRAWDETTLAFAGPCLAPMLPFSVSGDGALSFDTNKLVMDDATYGCTVHVGVRFEAHGSLDPAFKRAGVGGLDAAQVRSFDMSLAR
jgi:hypothetical protein